MAQDYHFLVSAITSMERAAKLRRLENFRRKLPHTSASALSAILKEVDSSGMPDIHNRRALQVARDMTMAIETPYGPIVQDVQLELENGGRMALKVVHPFAMLWLLFSTVNSFSSLLDARIVDRPPSFDNPWSLALYSDEVTPGNVLAHEVKRKTQVVYMSFLELGPLALASEDAWMCITAKRSNTLKDVKGGMAQVFGAILKLMFPSEGTSMSDGGVTLQSARGTQLRFHARLAMFLQDGAAHKFTWHCKGDAGSKLCMLCKNLFTSASGVCQEDDLDLLRCDVIYADDLELASDRELIQLVRDLNIRRLTDDAAAFKVRQQAYGFTWKSYNLLTDPVLRGTMRPTTQFAHDWMHTLFVSGVFNTVLFIVLERTRATTKAIYSLAHGYVSQWRWPKHLNVSSISDCLAPSRRQVYVKDGRFKCTASEALSLYSVLAVFLQTVCVASDIAVGACAVYFALCDVIDCIIGSQYGRTTPEQLMHAVHLFMQMFVTEFGFDKAHSKFHWLLHLGYELRTYGTLLSCFVHERKHRMVKRYAQDVKNTLHFEATVLHEVTSHHIQQLTSFVSLNFEIGPLRPSRASRSLQLYLERVLELEQLFVYACEPHFLPILHI